MEKTAPTVPREALAPDRRIALGRHALGALFMAPLLVLLVVFVFYPVIDTFRQSFFRVSLRGDETFVGLDNYRAMLDLPAFGQIVRNTIVWVALGVALKVVGGLLVALVLNERFRAKPWVTMAVLVPWATPYVVSAITWRWIYDGLYGYLNSVLLRLGIVEEPTAWLTSPRWALLVVLFTHVWTGIPFCALTILSALYSIPDSLYRAAKMDGAGALARFRYVALPQIYPVIAILVVLTAIWGFNAFEMIFVMTGGGPGYSSEILVTSIYRYAFQFHQPGLASAIAMVGFLVLLILMFAYLRINRRLGVGDERGRG